MRILVVEDQHRIAGYVKKGLEHAGYVVDVAYDGQEGYDFASTEEYDVILMDVMMPKMSGVQVVERLRKEGNHTPILMLTAKDGTKDRVEGLDAGADDYLPKPFAFEELLARVRALSRRPKKQENDTLKVGDLTVDLKTMKVERGTRVIALSKKEFALLVFLMRNRGHVYSKEQLTEKVWSYDADVTPNTAQVYIGYLRKKIDLPFPHKEDHIQTVRGFGYKLV